MPDLLDCVPLDCLLEDESDWPEDFYMPPGIPLTHYFKD